MPSGASYSKGKSRFKMANRELDDYEDCLERRCEWLTVEEDKHQCAHPEEMVNVETGFPCCPFYAKAVRKASYLVNNQRVSSQWPNASPAPKVPQGKDIYELGIHEMTHILNDKGDVIYYVTRVPGGWIYEAQNSTLSALCFVPYIDRDKL